MATFPTTRVGLIFLICEITSDCYVDNTSTNKVAKDCFQRLLGKATIKKTKHAVSGKEATLPFPKTELGVESFTDMTDMTNMTDMTGPPLPIITYSS